MLTRLYIDNFRCFEKFEWKPGRKQLILGRNGTGKSSLMDALARVIQAVGGDRIEEQFKLIHRTKWLNQPAQVFEIEADLNGTAYRYKLVVEPWGEPARPRIRSEILWVNGKVILVFEDGEVVVYPSSDSSGIGYDLDQSRSALSSAGATGVHEFREWLKGISLWHLNPFQMGPRAESEDVTAKIDLSNFAAWYRHLIQSRPRENVAFLQDLRESLDGFDQLILADAGEAVRILYAEFLGGGKSIKVPFGELSEGQRCLVCLYAIMHFVAANGGTTIIDEPDNFISLREIQPWLMAMEEAADDKKGQVILISHHPEILNQWAGPYGVQFVRDDAGPVRVEEFKGDPASSLTVAELVARGWDS